jgi:nucleoside diphosphate kinase
MTERFKNISLEEDNSLYNYKRINLPYTIAILKPEICSNPQHTQEVINIIEDAEFDIRFLIQRDLTQQESENLFYNHKSAEYFKKLVSYNSSGEVMVFLLSHEKEDPVTKWKAMIGHRDPEVGKKDEPDSLR